MYILIKYCFIFSYPYVCNTRSFTLFTNFVAFDAYSGYSVFTVLNIFLPISDEGLIIGYVVDIAYNWFGLTLLSPKTSNKTSNYTPSKNTEDEYNFSTLEDEEDEYNFTTLEEDE